MKKLFLILLTGLFLQSCSDKPMEHIGTDFIEGTVSHIEPFKPGGYGIIGHNTILYVQSPTQTISIDLPLRLADRWKVGDTIIVITQKYKVIEKK